MTSSLKISYTHSLNYISEKQKQQKQLILSPNNQTFKRKENTTKLSHMLSMAC